MSSGPKWWQEGRSEIERKIRLAISHFHLWQQTRHLAQAETELGKLAWQQADFVDPEILKRVDEIIDYEKNQAALLNREANLSWEKSEKQTAREKARATADEVLDQFARERRDLSAARRTQQSALLEKSRKTAPLRQQLLQVQGEIEQLQILQSKIEKFETDEAAQEARRISAQLDELSSREKDLKHTIDAHADLDRAACAELAAVEEQISKLEDAIEERRTALEAKEAEIDTEIARIEDEQRRMREMADALEHQKTSPFQLIGECLADHNIGSRNQPEALENVHATRYAIAVLKQQIDESLQESARADRSAIMLFYFVVVVAVFALVLFVAMVL